LEHGLILASSLIYANLRILLCVSVGVIGFFGWRGYEWWEWKLCDEEMGFIVATEGQEKANEQVSEDENWLFLSLNTHRRELKNTDDADF